jgi:hypothetical protein
MRFTAPGPLGPRTLFAFLVALAVLKSEAARADRGALTLEVGGGVTVLRAVAPSANNSASQVGTVPEILLGGRYAVTNSLELGATVFGAFSGTFFIPSTTITSDSVTLSGTLQTQVQRYGFLGGVRFLHGNVWRLMAGAEAGWALTMHSSMHLIADSGASAGRDFGLTLQDKSVNSLVLAPSMGVGWVGDKLSVTLLPRFEVLIGGGTTWAFSIPITAGWDFYL